ncbi:MAG: hypothetical protein B6245_16045 [Desulfobacteraceae bacterium 4572_88]|nr:MAG: hypothetical protein B6245_16045 [Desulfobacteraceae bacterium 4572_88]
MAGQLQHTLDDLNHEILEHRRTEQELQESEEKYRILVENQTDLIVKFDTGGRLLFVSKSYCDTFGKTREQLIGKKFMPLIHEQDRETVSRAIAKVHSPPYSSHVEERVMVKDGWRWQAWRNTGILDENGCVTAITAIGRDITDRKHAEDSLRKSEELFSSQFEVANIGLAITSPDKGWIRANKTLCEILGYSEEELKGKTWSEMTHPDDLESDTKMFEKVMSGEIDTYELDKRFVRKDGNSIYIHLTVGCVRNPDKTVNYFIASKEDITARKQAAAALQSRKTFLDRVIDQSPFAIWISDAEGTLQRANPALKKFLNLTDEQLVGKYNVFKDPLAERQGLTPLIRTVYEESRSISFTCDWDGNDIPALDLKGSNSVSIEATMFPIHNSENDLTNVVLTWIDITKRKRAEEELRHLRNYLSNIINSMPSMLIGIDTESKVTQWNKTAEQITGIPADVAQGRTLADVFPRMVSEMEKIAESIRTSETRQERKKPQVSENGETRYEDVTVYPLIANGAEGAVIRIDDVTDRVRMEEMMIQGEKMLSVGGLAAGMAHEINNPLAGMMQTANVMANRLGEKMDMPANLRAAEAAGTTMEAIRNFMDARDIPRMLSAITESGRRAAAIVENMLSFARKSDDRAYFHDLEKLLDKTLELAASDYDLKKHYDFKLIQVKKEYEDNLPPVPCEGARIQQVLLNILRNGAHAMQEGSLKGESPCFILRLAHEREAGRVCIEIEDNGPGMDEDTLKRVFEPFFTTKAVGIGTGLGLSVSYFIITENHEGEMTVESRPGAGAKFIIRLPLKG